MMKRTTRIISGAVVIALAVLFPGCAWCAANEDAQSRAPVPVSSVVRTVETLGKYPPVFDRKADHSGRVLMLLRDAYREHDVFEDGANLAWEAMRSRDGSCSVYDFRFDYGDQDATIQSNLASLVRTAGPGWWREIQGGYVVYSGKTVKPDLTAFRGPNARFPAVTLYSNGLDKSCAFLASLAEVTISVRAQHATNVVMETERLRGVHEEQVHFNAEAGATLAEILSRLATFHGCVARATKNGFVIEDPSQEDIRARIDEILEPYRGQEISWYIERMGPNSMGYIRCYRWERRGRSTRMVYYPDYTTYRLPASAGPELLPYLNDPDDNVVNLVLLLLLDIDGGIGREEFLRLLDVGHNAAGDPLSDFTKELLARNLAFLSDEVALSYIEAIPAAERAETLAILRHADERQPDLMTGAVLVTRNAIYEAVLLAGRIPTQQSAACQRRLISQFSVGPPVVKAGSLRVESIPPAITKDQAQELELVALKMINNVLGPFSDEKATAEFSFTSDGKSARYALELGYYHGPLAAHGSEYVVEFKRAGDTWIIVRAYHGGQWWS